MSTFADAYLPRMTPAQLQQYDLFLDENDWDIYYWATQEPSPTSTETAEGAGPDAATPSAGGTAFTKDEWRRAPAAGEWAQTVGTYKPAYRPVPQRWKGSEVLQMLRQHVENRSAGGKESVAEANAEAAGHGVRGVGGMGRMPDLR